MGMLSKKLRSLEGGCVAFSCPGCGNIHGIPVNKPGGWTWNGDAENPTFSPSLLVQSGHYAPGWQGNHCWCTYNAEHKDEPSDFVCYICHSFVTNGKIQFLGDCTHSLANQTVDIPDWGIE